MPIFRRLMLPAVSLFSSPCRDDAAFHAALFFTLIREYEQAYHTGILLLEYNIIA